MRNLSALLVLMLLAGSLAADEASFQVVVNASNPVSSLAKDRVSRLFLKKETRWNDGKKVLPVDQVEARQVRHDFSRQVHSKEVAWIKSYWHQMIFSGRAVAPAQLSSDGEVISYVRDNAGAIGYVSAGASIGEGVKRLEITD